MTERDLFDLPIQVAFHRSSEPPIEIGAKEEWEAMQICEQVWRKEFVTGQLLICEIRRAPVDVWDRLAAYLDNLEPGDGASARARK